MIFNMKRKHIIIAAVIAGLIAVGVVLIVFGSADQSPAGGVPSGGFPPGGPGMENQKAEAASVRVVAAEVKTLRPYIDESGDVEANVNVDIYPDIGGKLIAFTVAIGDPVSKGDTIARIDPSKPGADYSINLVPSPITGTVTGILVDRGATVSTATAIATVGIISDLKITVNLPESDSAKAAKGMTAAVTFEAIPGESFPAAVTRVSPVLNPKSRSREITLGLTKNDPRISAGMYAKLRLYTTPLSGQVVIPVDAIVVRNDETCVFVAAGKVGATVAERRIVKTGTAVDSDVIVSKGVAAGENVITEGQNGLADGAKVSVLREASK
jgi:membrane fusion protein (multidrug efflux system)